MVNIPVERDRLTKRGLNKPWPADCLLCRVWTTYFLRSINLKNFMIQSEDELQRRNSSSKYGWNGRTTRKVSLTRTSVVDHDWSAWLYGRASNVTFLCGHISGHWWNQLKIINSQFLRLCFSQLQLIVIYFESLSLWTRYKLNLTASQPLINS